MARLVIADDSDLMRRMLRNFLYDFPRFEIVGEVRNYAEAIAAVSELKPDLLLLDIQMPGFESRGAQAASLAAACECPIVTMSFAADAEARVLAASTGASFLVDKANLYHDLIPAMDAALLKRKQSRTV